MRKTIPITIRRLLTTAIMILAVFDTAIAESAKQDFYFRNLEVEDGLSQNTVYDILQDSKGRIWAATADGISIYDGHSFNTLNLHTADEVTGSNLVLRLLQGPDDKIYICSINQLLCYDPVIEEMSRVTMIDESGNEISETPRAIALDYLGNIWVAVSNFGLFKIDRQGICTPISFKEKLGTSNIIFRSMFLAQDGTLWISSYDSGLLRYTPSSNDLCAFSGEDSYPFNDIWGIAPLDNDQILAGCGTEGLFTFDIRTHEFSRYRSPDDNIISSTLVHEIFTDSQNRIWICSENGLYVLSRGICSHIEYSSNDRFSLSDNAVYSICEDSEGGIWVGTYFGGLCYTSATSSQFKKYFPGPGKYQISGKCISEICPDSKGNMWIGTEDAGLNYLNTANGTFTNGYIDAKNVHALHFVSKDELWVGTYASGIYVLDSASGITRHYESSQEEGSLIDNRVYAIFHDHFDNVWIGTQRGLCLYDRATDRFRPVNYGATYQVNDIVQDIDGNVWFTFMGKGLVKYYPSENKWEDISVGEELGNGRTLFRAITLLIDHEYNLWVGTEGDGMYLYDFRKKCFIRHYGEAEGLPNNTVYKILEDNDDHIWGSTNKGLFRLDPQNGNIACFKTKSGLPSNQFNYKSGLKLPNGELMFGGVKGLVSFNPSNVEAETPTPQVILTKFQIFSDSVSPAEDGSPLKKSILYSDRIILKHTQSVFSISFSVVNYSGAENFDFYYRLKGLQKEWTSFGQSSTVTYSKLHHGEYEFCIKAIGKGTSTSTEETKLSIKILPPWYKSIAAIILYILLSIFAAISAIQILIKTSRKKNESLIEKMQQEKEEEIRNSKIEFFTNITHEIKTPLTLISIPLEEVMKKIGKEDPNFENLSIIRRNANRLLKLVNELLNFKKIDPKGTQPNFQPMDIRVPVHDTCGRFVPTASIKGIELVENMPEESIDADIDETIFTKILSNLLSNALKHAFKSISVSAVSDGRNFRVIVSNDGDRIPASEAQHIFEPFVKLEADSPGTGIGLAFARNLAETHNGSLELDTMAKDVTFILELPLKQENAIRTVREWKVDDTQEETGPESMTQTNSAPSKTILLVEDNKELLSILASKLEKDYRILTAGNGVEALNHLDKSQIDLVVSDIMMPEMDGFELCEHIKENIDVSHIPVILLTAKSDTGSQIEAFKTGADEFITKPFSFDILKARIENLLKSREQLKKVFVHSPSESLSTISHSKADELFLNKLLEYINSHLEQEIDVEDIAIAMNLSRATLYRKLKGVTELSPNDFVKLCRLRKAAELLKNSEYRVNEVAYLVGFNSTSYFTKCFSKQFGVLPKDYK